MKTKNILIATAAAALFLTGTVNARADQSMGSGDTVKCLGINSCKGQGSCKTVNNACKGQNACKGHGASNVSAKECKDKGGTEASK